MSGVFDSIGKQVGSLLDITGIEAEERAISSQEQQNIAEREFRLQLAEQARGDLFNLFPQAQQNRELGFQSALDVLGQTIPQQLTTLQRGSRGAQGQLIRGVNPFQQAILGTNIRQIQAGPRIPLSVDFARQQLPDFQTDALNPLDIGA